MCFWDFISGYILYKKQGIYKVSPEVFCKSFLSPSAIRRHDLAVQTVCESPHRLQHSSVQIKLTVYLNGSFVWKKEASIDTFLARCF